MQSRHFKNIREKLNYPRSEVESNHKQKIIV